MVRYHTHRPVRGWNVGETLPAKFLLCLANSCLHSKGNVSPTFDPKPHGHWM